MESDYSVCPRPFLQFLQFFQLMSDKLRQVTSGYVSLRRRDGTWSSTINHPYAYKLRCKERRLSLHYVLISVEINKLISI